MIRKGFAVALASVATAGLPVLAQDKSGPNLGTTAADATPSSIAAMALSHELFELGTAQSDALTVLAAAKLAASVDADPAEPAALDPERIAFIEGEQETFGKKVAPTAPAAPPSMMTDGGPRTTARATFFTASSDDGGTSDAPATAEVMFAKARELAADDDSIRSLVDDAVAEGSRGRVGGAVEWLSRLPAGQTDVWEIAFYGNSYAEVAIIGDGDANLDAAVTDENGNVICYDVSWSDKLYCDWTPAWDGYFYVTVQNTGGSRNSYYLVTN